jgi:hypothetical protein
MAAAAIVATVASAAGFATSQIMEAPEAVIARQAMAGAAEVTAALHTVLRVTAAATRLVVTHPEVTPAAADTDNFGDVSTASEVNK